MKARLYFDIKCPVCNNYCKLLQRKIPVQEIEFLPASTDVSEFQYISKEGKSYRGEQAIEQLASDFPTVKNYFWMLPEKYKVKALKVAYKVGSIVRKAISHKKGCGCGK